MLYLRHHQKEWLAVARIREILDLRNHREVKRVLISFGAPDTSLLDDAVFAQARAWFRLGKKHLRIARLLMRVAPKNWRSVVSRAYYASYNASKAVRYLVNGSVRLDGEDHKHVGDLPDDFPERDSWSAFLTDLRDARNMSDYDPWPETYRQLPKRPSELLDGARAFVQSAADYLKGRGMRA